ncbi:hypothetical protein T492DRAFT_1081034 [Pavlovales sp. CCMP2436]|nr:hypothetical protein T492DRAFT_1081034 [Pavlovales sp. CCMP2436]
MAQRGLAPLMVSLALAPFLFGAFCHGIEIETEPHSPAALNAEVAMDAEVINDSRSSRAAINRIFDKKGNHYAIDNLFELVVSLHSMATAYVANNWPMATAYVANNWPWFEKLSDRLPPLPPAGDLVLTLFVFLLLVIVMAMFATRGSDAAAKRRRINNDTAIPRQRRNSDAAVPGGRGPGAPAFPASSLSKLVRAAGIGRAGLVLNRWLPYVSAALAITAFLEPETLVLVSTSALLLPFFCVLWPMFICVHSTYPFKPVGAWKYVEVQCCFAIAVLCTLTAYWWGEFFSVLCFGNGSQTMHERFCGVIWVHKEQYVKFVAKHTIPTDDDDDEEEEPEPKADPAANAAPAANATPAAVYPPAAAAPAAIAGGEDKEDQQE